MDVMMGLTLASKSLELLKGLRDIDAEFNKAEYKLKIAEFYTNLAGIKIALSEAKTQLHEKDNRGL